MKITKRLLILTMCLMFIVGSTLIPVSAEEACDHVTGIKIPDHAEYFGSCYDYCFKIRYFFLYSCCGAMIYDDSIRPHEYIMTAASYMTCQICGFERDVR